jgi:hypothetical protein
MEAQSNELTRGTSELVQHLRLQGVVYIAARALLDIIFLWFGYIACLSQWGGGGYFSRSNEEGGGVRTLWVEAKERLRKGNVRNEKG